jgi:hypothetical protein
MWEKRIDTRCCTEHICQLPIRVYCCGAVGRLEALGEDHPIFGTLFFYVNELRMSVV